ncbi:PD40 domain-containing protein [[Muricauda] lutisoli]|uniref:PD40 domain-containing protein n=1 Tax=[Muricauda] lutisoli TaxID=2816035 RepID=A0ABS3F004_9FLAO|nr:PD40 domain-containing protein [[Muricauda] lutisoli]MBO0331837.1 PD40 domain-containing protein [[Muricauda] lutisoli]
MNKELGNKVYIAPALLLALVFLSCVTIGQNKNDQNDQVVTYFGQHPPGRVAKIFAPGIVSVTGRYEYAVSFSPDLSEMYFTGEKEGENQKVYYSGLDGKKWTNPEPLQLTKGKKKNEFEAFVDTSGNGLFFAAYDSIFSDEKIWFTKRLENVWAKADKLDSPINNDIVFYPNTALNGDLYYTSISKRKMCYSPYKNGKYEEVREVEIEFGIHGFISPKQDFILVDAPKENDKTRDRDIYVSFKKKNGTWSKPINLGNAVNSDFNETCPSISPDGKYLFFSRYNENGDLSNIYWVSAEVIQELKPTNL